MLFVDQLALQIAAHLIVDHISRNIDKREAAAKAPPKVSGDIGSTRRARLRRAALRAQLLGELVGEE
jgi:hypothetical protein